MEEADASRARYRYDKRRPEGISGMAWSRPATALLFNALPRFEATTGATKREVMEAYYVSELGVRPETVESISDYMEDVRAIVSYTFQDGQGQFLGLLSLDLHRAEIRVIEQEVKIVGEALKEGQGAESHKRKVLSIVPYEADEAELIVDSEGLLRLIRAVGNVLESFKSFEEREAIYG